MLWYHKVYAYTHNYQVMFCPDRKDKGPDYGMNWLATGVNLSRAYDAATCIVIGDVAPETICAHTNWPAPGSDPAEWWINDVGNDLCVATNDNSYKGTGYPPTHNDGAIYGYLDGHVKWSREEQVDQVNYWNPYAPPP